MIHEMKDAVSCIFRGKKTSAVPFKGYSTRFVL